MHSLRLIDVLMIGILAFVIFLPPDLRRPPRPPRHRVPGQEPDLLYLLLRIKSIRRTAGIFDLNLAQRNLLSTSPRLESHCCAELQGEAHAYTDHL